MDLIRFGRLAAAMVAGACLAAGCTSTSTSATAPSAAKCQVSADAAPMQFGANGGSGTLTVSAERDCTWAVSTQAGWVALASAPNGNGDAALSYTVARNTVPAARSAELVVGAQHIQLTQAAAACTYALDRDSDTVPASGGTLAIQLSTLTGCAWTASSSASWLTFGGGATSGSASGSIAIIVAANGGAARSGEVTIGGRTFSIAQAAAAVPTPAPAPGPGPSPSPDPTPTPAPTPTPTPTPTPISLTGSVSLLTGSCPTLRFSLSERTVTTDPDTRFSRGRCGDLSDNDKVSVDGMLQADGTVTAQTVTIDKNAK